MLAGLAVQRPHYSRQCPKSSNYIADYKPLRRVRLGQRFRIDVAVPVPKGVPANQRQEAQAGRIQDRRRLDQAASNQRIPVVLNIR